MGRQRDFRACNVSEESNTGSCTAKNTKRTMYIRGHIVCKRNTSEASVTSLLFQHSSYNHFFSASEGKSFQKIVRLFLPTVTIVNPWPLFSFVGTDRFYYGLKHLRCTESPAIISSDCFSRLSLCTTISVPCASYSLQRSFTQFKVSCCVLIDLATSLRENQNRFFFFRVLRF